MTMINVNWGKLTVQIISGLTMFCSLMFYAGKLVNTLDTVVANQAAQKADMNDLKAKADTISTRQIADNYQLKLQIHDLWDAINNNKIPSGAFTREQYKQGRNGPLTLTQIH